jgi:hypothetical protein
VGVVLPLTLIDAIDGFLPMPAYLRTPSTEKNNVTISGDDIVFG